MKMRQIAMLIVVLAAIGFSARLILKSVAVAAEEPQNIVEVLLKRTEQAQVAWVNGDSRPYEELFAHTEELTFMTPFGGEPLRGWEAIGPRMARAAKDFESGTSRLELVEAVVSQDAICLVMVERGEVKFAGREKAESWNLRVTQLYLFDGENWRVVHRHVDPLIVRHSLDEVLSLFAK